MRTRSNKKRQHDDGRAGVSGGAATRETRSRAPRTATPFAAPGRVRASARHNGERPRHSPPSLFGWALWRGFSFVSLSPPAPSAPPLRGRGADLRTITPVH